MLTALIPAPDAAAQPATLRDRSGNVVMGVGLVIGLPGTGDAVWFWHDGDITRHKLESRLRLRSRSSRATSALEQPQGEHNISVVVEVII